MSNNERESSTEQAKRRELLAEIESYKQKIRQQLLAIVEHPCTPADFKNHPAVRRAVL